MVLLSYVYRSVVARLRTYAITMVSVALFVTGATVGLSVYLGLKAELVNTAPADNILVIGDGAVSEWGSFVGLEPARKIALLEGIKKQGDAPLTARELVTAVHLDTDSTRYREPSLVRGIDATSFVVHHAKLVKGEAPKPGSLDVIIGAKLARRYPHLEVGKTVALPGGAAPITGIFSTEGGPLENEVWTLRDALQLHLDTKDSSSLTLVAESPARVPELVNKINASKNLEVHAASVADLRSGEAGLATILRLVLALLILLSVVATFAIGTTLSAAVRVRIPELATLVVVGFRRSRLVRMVLIESVVLAVLGAIIGAVAHELIRMKVGSVTLGDNTIELHRMWLVPMVGIGVGALVGLFGAIVPSLVVWRLDINDTMR